MKNVLHVFNKYLLKNKLRYFLTNKNFSNSIKIYAIIYNIHFNFDVKKNLEIY